MGQMLKFSEKPTLREENTTRGKVVEMYLNRYYRMVDSKERENSRSRR